MSDENPVLVTNPPKMSRKLVATLLAGVLVFAGGITAVSVGVVTAAAEETARQCAAALKESASANETRTASLEKAAQALEAVKSVDLPGDEAWTSTDYAARGGVEAVEAVPAVEASEGVEAVAAVDAVPARPSGAEHIASSADAREVLAEIQLPTDCAEREDAANITSLAGKATTATKILNASVTTLLDDFAAFQVDETARIVAEIEAARIAAEAEAARVAAEAAAKAQAETARKRAASAKSTGGGGTSTGSSGGGYSSPPGGGRVGPPGEWGPVRPECRIDNGVGGFYSC